MTTLWRKLLTFILGVFIAVNVLQVIIEFKFYEDRYRDIDFLARQAVAFTRTLSQSTNTESVDDGVTADGLQQWIDAVSKAPNKSEWLTKAIDTIKKTKGKYNQFTPLNFGLTYLNKKTFGEEVKRMILETVEYNYGGKGKNNPTSGRVPGTLLIDNVIVTVSDPKVLNLRQDDLTRRKLFGTANPSLGSFGTKFDSVISYDIDIEIHWSSVTSTPLFNLPFEGSDNIRTYSGKEPHLAGQAVITGPVKRLRTSYTLTN